VCAQALSAETIQCNRLKTVPQRAAFCALRTCVVTREDLQQLWDRCSVATGTRLWNSLPAGLRQTNIGYKQFKWLLKTYLFGHWCCNICDFLFKLHLSKFYLLTYYASIGCVHNQKSDRSRFVRRDRSRPMKKNMFVIYHHELHTITSLYRIIPPKQFSAIAWKQFHRDVPPIAIWNWLLERLRHMRHGSGLKMCYEVGFFSDASKQI